MRSNLVLIGSVIINFAALSAAAAANQSMILKSWKSARKTRVAPLSSAVVPVAPTLPSIRRRLKNTIDDMRRSAELRGYRVRAYTVDRLARREYAS
jgi:hypothetical protein